MAELSVKEVRRQQTERPDLPVSRSGAMCWYLTGKGEIIRGQVVRDSDWEDRKAAQLGGLKFLGRAEYGPGGNCLPALQQLVGRNPELQEIIDRNLENRKRSAYERANREQVKRDKQIREKAEEAALMADAMRLMQDSRDETDETDDENSGREPGPRKKGGQR